MEDQGSVYCGAICTNLASSANPPSPSLPKEARRPASQLFPDRSIIPRDPNPNIRPRSAFQFEFGEYGGEPNYLLRSKKGIDWTNLPPELHALCVEKQADHKDILEFTLGPEGKFYIAYMDGNDVRTKSSAGLWTSLNEDFRRGGLKQLELGPEGIFWGLKAYRDYTHSPHQSTSHLERTNTGGSGFSSGMRSYTVMEEPFGKIPDSLYQTAQGLYSDLAYYDDIDFVAVGVNGSWVMGALGKLVFWDNIEAKVIKQLTDMWESGTIRNVELSPVRPDIYFIEPAVGRVAYRVPDAWFPRVREHLQDHYRLDYDSTDRTPIMMAKPAATSRPGTGGGYGQQHERRPTTGSRGRGRGRGSSRSGSSGGGGGGGGSSNFIQPHVPPPGPTPGVQSNAYNPPPPSLPPQGQWAAPQQQPIHQYANEIQTSGKMQRRRQSSGKGWQIATEVIKATPALIGAGLQIAALTGGCVVM
ncbi:hypothetical protein FRB96_005249 [Tulasnella sp. 330]|nr:hypothetical protein FRB96_005249 [Tulasnella sp. 330]